MDLVIYTALGVGLATVVGAGIGFLFKNITDKSKFIYLYALSQITTYLSNPPLSLEIQVISVSRSLPSFM